MINGTVHTIAISIGRNIKDEPLPEAEWEDFKDRVYKAAQRCGSLILATTTGNGSYYSKETHTTITEETAITLIQLEHFKMQGLQVLLSGIAYAYDQEGIGFTAAPSETTFLKSEPFNTERD